MARARTGRRAGAGGRVGLGTRTWAVPGVSAPGADCTTPVCHQLGEIQDRLACQGTCARTRCLVLTSVRRPNTVTVRPQETSFRSSRTWLSPRQRAETDTSSQGRMPGLRPSQAAVLGRRKYVNTAWIFSSWSGSSRGVDSPTGRFGRMFPTLELPPSGQCPLCPTEKCGRGARDQSPRSSVPRAPRADPEEQRFRSVLSSTSRRSR